MSAASAAVVACQSLDPRALRALLNESQPPETIQGHSAIYWATTRVIKADPGDRPAALEILELLLAAGADPNGSGKGGARISALMEAATHSDLPVMRRLLASGARVDAVTGLKVTALHWAAAAGSLAAVRLLVEKGAEVDAMNDTGQTPLHWAAKRLNKPMIKELYLLGANFEIKDNKGESPLDRISNFDPRLAKWWKHKPGRDALEQGTPAAPSKEIRLPRRL